MKKKIIYGAVAVLAAVLLNSCQSELEQLDQRHYTNKLFISTTEVSEDILVKPGSGDVTRSISIATAMPVEEEISVTLRADAALLSDFRKEFQLPEAQMFPLDNLEVENPRLVIKKGSCSSSSTALNFTGLSDLDMDVTYVLPVVLKNTSAVETLRSKSHYYYIFKGAALINVVCNFTDNRAGAASWKTPEKFTNMTHFTCEALVRQNVADRMISTIMGVEGHYLLRIGDAGVPSNQLQIASSSNQSNNKMTFTAGKWTHVACVFDAGKTTVYFDGKKVMDNLNSGRSSITWGAYGNDDVEKNGRYFWLGYSYASDRYLDGEMSEVRVWERCLTEEEINSTNHFYSVDPSSEGLVAYWKMDEGSGTVLKDSSPNGNDLTLKNKTTWPKVSLPEKN